MSSAPVQAPLRKARSTAAGPNRVVREDPPAVRWALTAAALLVVGIMIVVPVANVFWQAFRGEIGRAHV